LLTDPKLLLMILGISIAMGLALPRILKRDYGKNAPSDHELMLASVTLAIVLFLMGLFAPTLVVVTRWLHLS
jgi:hypothetical protein